MAERMVLVIRHAEAGATPAGQSDFDRPLSEDGVRQARELGLLLATGVLPTPQLVLTSAAVRARQTWQHAAAVCGGEIPVQAERLLYGADRDEIVDLVRELPDDLTSIAVVGHAPELPGLARSVPDARSEGDAFMGWPPACVGVLATDAPWTDFPDGARLVLTRMVRP